MTSFITKHILIPVLLIAFLSCEREALVYIEENDDITLAVEAIITSEYKTQNIKLTKPFFKVDTTPTPVTNARITITTSNNLYTFHEDPDSAGLYLSDTLFAAGIDKDDYHLEIIYQTDTFVANTEIIRATPINNIPYEKSWKNDSLYILSKTFSSSEEAMWKIEVDWSHIEAYKDTLNKALTYIYTFNTVDANQVFAPNKELIEFPSGSIIRVKKHALSQKQADYYRALLSEVEWSGGYFDVTPAKTPTNISGKAVGYFCVCTVTKDSVVVK